MPHNDLHTKALARARAAQTARPDTSVVDLEKGGGKETPNDNPQSITEYPKNFVKCTSAGHVLEMNNSSGGERVRLINGGTGSFIDMDSDGKTYIQSKNELHLKSDHSTTLVVGKDIKKDKLVIKVVGDCHLQVEGDLHTEVLGDRYDSIAGNWKVETKGSTFMTSRENIGIEADSELRIIANEINQKMTFAKTDMAAGGQVVEEINGNRVIRMSKEGGTFAIESEGDLRFNVKGCRYDKIGRNYFTEVQGKIKINAIGDDVDCIEGGAPAGMDVEKPEDSPYGNPTGWELTTGETSVRITAEDFYMAATGSAKMEAGGDEFKIECDNGIYLN